MKPKSNAPAALTQSFVDGETVVSPKYFRYIEFQGFQNTPGVLADTISHFPPWSKNAWNGLPMYQRYALPVPSTGLSALKIFGCVDCEWKPTGVFEGLAFDGVAVQSGFEAIVALRDQQRFLLELVHTAVMANSPRYGYALEPFQIAKARVIAEGFRYEFLIGKPISSPNRKLKVQAFFRYDERPYTFIVIRDACGNEQSRFLFAHAFETSIGRIKWQSNDTIVVMDANRKDYWLCTIDGHVEFRYPQADSNDPHAIYRLATILLDDKYVIPNREKGMELLELSARLGYKHAINRLARDEQSDATEDAN